ncbi:3-keto-disaccharide hydrolase [Chitinophaga sp. ARDCPP14]|uniref:3-keto-disaccharide hydrolase n=1 Tax=Chitinophaga sp. ARDCPP14 TaxID=3391139 RepID=UPI003F5211B6
MLKKTSAMLIPLAAASLLFTTASCQNGAGKTGDSHTGDSTGNDKGFVQIFDGKTLNGWVGDSIHWRAENGHIVGQVTPETLLKTNTFLIWQGDQPADFELTCEFKITSGGNSGINYRSVMVENVPHALKGYQADIDGANRYTGQNYEERGRTTLAYRGQKTTIPEATDSLKNGVKNNAWSAAVVTGSLGSSDSLQTLIKSEDWNKCRLVVKGNHLQHYINGVLMSDVTDNDTVNGKSKGLLGVQVHVGPPMTVEYRDIMLKRL